MTRTYQFRIDTCHLSHEIDQMFDGWVPINVELSDEEITETLNRLKEWHSSDVFKEKQDVTIVDDEYFLHHYVPAIHQKVRKALEGQAPSIWGEKIMPELYNVDIYLPKEFDWMIYDE